ncbi:uncharacterized protein LOC112347697, partial [Selaginella moellendorffii]|uniref:uncharacterized protein LOC112347697 n=1 Tax=Selaginella moellendorffii TaxID=88036 RepID=UPI000D1CB965
MRMRRERGGHSALWAARNGPEPYDTDRSIAARIASKKRKQDRARRIVSVLLDLDRERMIGDFAAMHGTNLLKKVLKPRNLTPTPGQSSSKKDSVPSRRSSSAGATDSSSGARSPGGKPTCTCSPTTHAGSFRCRLHRAGNGRSHGLTPSAMPKSDGPKKPFKGSSSYTISSVDIHAPQSRPAVPRPAPAAAAAKNKHRGKPSRLSR